MRSGIKHLTIVDFDRVCITDINRHTRYLSQRALEAIITQQHHA